MAKPYKQEKKAYKKAKRKYVSLWKAVALICVILTVIMAPVNIVLGMFDNTISLLVAGNSFWELENRDADAIYYPNMGVSQAERLEAGNALCYEVEAEGAALLLNLRTMQKTDFATVPDCPGGLGDRIFASAAEARSFSELCDAAKTRRYTMTRVKRAALAAALGVDSSLTTAPPPYLRILASGKKGRPLMAFLAKNSRLPVSQSLASLERGGARAAAFANLERRAFELHCLTMPSPLPRGEFRQKIYMMQED